MATLPPATPLPSSSEAQLTQLNERSRWYSSQSWQLPIAYLALTGVSVGEFTGAARGWAMIAAAVLGGASLWHLCGIRDGEKRAVKALIALEAQLHLENATLYKGWYSMPLWIALAIAVVIYLGVGGYLISAP